MDRVAVSVPHRATWVFPCAHSRRPGTVHPECTAGLECTVPAIPIESGDDLLVLVAATRTDRRPASAAASGMTRLGEPAVSRATAAHSPVRAVRARAAVVPPCAPLLWLQGLIGTKRLVMSHSLRTVLLGSSSLVAVAAVPFHVRWRVVIPGSFCRGPARRGVPTPADAATHGSRREAGRLLAAHT